MKNTISSKINFVDILSIRCLSEKRSLKFSYQNDFFAINITLYKQFIGKISIDDIIKTQIIIILFIHIFQMEGTNLRAQAQKCLQKVIRNYKPQRYQTYMINFEATTNLSELIRQLCLNKEHLNLKLYDISQFLSYFGKDGNIRDCFGIQFYILWLEFFIISAADIRQRLDSRQLADIPKEKQKQLQFLKNILISHLSTYTNDKEKDLFIELSKQPYFKYLTSNHAAARPDLKSRISSNNSIVNISNLKMTQALDIFKNLLEKIVFKIGNIGEDNEGLLQRKANIVEMFNDILESNNELESEILTINLRQIIKHYLGIEVTINRCKSLKLQVLAIRQGFLIFKKFYIFSNLVIKFIQNKTSIDQLFDEVNKMLSQQINSLWYWPIFNGKSFISFLINGCIEDEKEIKQILTMLSKYPPSLKANIFNSHGRTFIIEVLIEINKGSYRTLIIKGLLQLCKLQKINMKKQQITGDTLEQIFLNHGANQSHLFIQTEEVDEEMNQFYIYDSKNRKRNVFKMTLQHTSELIDKFKSEKYEENQMLDSSGYRLTFSISDKYSQGVYTSGKFNKLQNFTSDISYEGILNYRNVTVFGNLIKKFDWKIIQRATWRFYELGSSEKQKVIDEFLNNKSNIFYIKIAQLDVLMEINTETLAIRTFQASQSINSMLKENFGYLIYLPAHKIQKREEQKGAIIQEEFVAVDEQLIGPNNSQEDNKEKEEVISFAQKFQFLGVFCSFFDKTDGFQVDEDQNILAKDRISIEYFKQWMETSYYHLIYQNLESDKNYVNKKVMLNSFKINKSLYFAINKQFRAIQKKEKPINDKWIEKSEEIMITNMKQTLESYNFFKCLLRYLELKLLRQKNKKNFVINIDSDQKTYLEQKMNEENSSVNIVEINNKRAEINCSNQQKQKLLSQIQTLNEVHQFIYQCPAAFKLMKEHDDEGFLQKFQYTYTEIDEDRFKIAMKLKHYPQFKIRLKIFHEMLPNLPGEILQMKVENEGQYLHLYTQQLSKFDIQVWKMGDHILIEYNSHFEKQLQETLKRIEQEKQKWAFKNAKKSSDQYIFKNIMPQILFEVKDRLQSLLRQKAKKGLSPIIEISRISKNEFSLKAIQIDKELQKILNEAVESLSRSYELFLNIKKKISTVQKYYNEYFAKLPKQKMKYYYERTIYVQFKKMIKKAMADIINPILEQNNQKLQQVLITYIRTQDLTNLLKTKLSEQQHTSITNKIKEQNFFKKFMEQWIDKCQNNSKVQVEKSMVKRHFTSQVDELQTKFNKFELKQSDLSVFFKSLNILGKIFYGDQLPITKHLTQFENLLKKNDVILVKVGTGSGKSTVIPPYLVGLGYKKVVVTQPRRLPCRQIFKRISNVFGSGITGFEIGDQSKDRQNSLVYMTDGLLKVQVLFDEAVLDKIDVLVIDQIHERSANIDMLLLFLNEYYRKGNKKLKLILCSATIDKQVSKVLEDMKLKIDVFQVQTQRFPVTQHKIQEGTILDRILLLCRKLKPDQQMLAFFPGVREVKLIVELLKNKFNRQAFPLYSNQPPSEQAQILKNGQIFISTSIAETSLTFRNLKYVIDSRISRWVKFNQQTELMETQQDFSSNSSIQQRKGRLGRTCSGQYHYFVYHSHDFANNRQHDRTQLEKVDLTNFIFQLLLKKNSNFQKATHLLARLNQEKLQFQRKVEYSKQILSNLSILSSSGNLIKGVQNLLTFGDLGNPQHNYALSEAMSKNCLINMIYLVSFFMMGMVAASDMLTYLKGQYKGSDLKVIHDFLIDTAAKINLPFIKPSQIMQEIKKNCYLIHGKPWSRILFRVFSKASQLLKSCSNYVPSVNWSDIIDILLQSYKNKIFFNQSLFGGNKSQYQKLQKKKEINYEEKHDIKMDQYRKTYQMNFQSLIFSKEKPPSIILSMSCNVNPLNQCILGMCEAIDLAKIKEQVTVVIRGCQCNQKYLKENDKIKNQRDIFGKFQTSLPNNISVSNNFPQLKLKGPFNKIAESFKKTVEPQRQNSEIRIDMNKILDETINNRAVRIKSDKLLPVIEPKASKTMFEKLTFNNFKDMFLTTKFQMQNNYEVNIEWQIAATDRFLVIKNAKNMHIQKILTKLKNFFRWFSDSQMICSQDFKIPPRFIEENPILSKDSRLKIMERVNQIVNSGIEHYVIKGWVHGRGPMTKYPRTAKMIAACWILVNIFNCVIKGGFVRDWVVNGQQVLNVNSNLAKLLEVNHRNKYFEVSDDKVTPSDIDAELSSHVLFDQQKFHKQMARLGIPVVIEQDGWRKHVIFDFGAPTGGFTADLIQPYTSMCHDSYDFDVNTMYIKKDHLNAIGLKIPLEYVDNYHHKTTKVSLEELIVLCQSKEMKKLKDNIPLYRFDKFKKRGWTIKSQQIFQPICYKSLITQSSPVDLSLIGKISKVFEQKMINSGPKVKIVRIESLKNKSWDEMFESIEYWIICELQAEEKARNPKGYFNTKIHSNNALLFHGTKPHSYKNIKQFGFDSRCFGSYGFYGRGVYFADDPTHSHSYTEPDAEGNRYMFIVKVALGKQEEIKKEQSTKLGPSKGFHSIYGTGKAQKEYIVERWGQAKPVYLITYK